MLDDNFRQSLFNELVRWVNGWRELLRYDKRSVWVEYSKFREDPAKAVLFALRELDEEYLINPKVSFARKFR